MDYMTQTDKLRALLDERGIEHNDNDTPINGVKSYMTTWHCTNGKLVSFIETEIPHATKLRIYNPTPEQAIAATVGPTLDQDLQQALDFMRIWITDDAHLGESDISYELEKAEGLRNLEAIEQAIAATVGNGTDLSKRLREVTGLRSFAELFGFDWHDESDWDWHDVACAMADAIDATAGVGTCRAVVCNVIDCEYNHKCRCTCDDLEIQDQECMTYRCRDIDYDEEEE